MAKDLKRQQRELRQQRRDMMRAARWACKGPWYARAIFWPVYQLCLIGTVPAFLAGVLSDMYFIFTGVVARKLELWAYPGIADWAALVPPDRERKVHHGHIG